MAMGSVYPANKDSLKTQTIAQSAWLLSPLRPQEQFAPMGVSATARIAHPVHHCAKHALVLLRTTASFAGQENIR